MKINVNGSDERVRRALCQLKSEVPFEDSPDGVKISWEKSETLRVSAEKGVCVVQSPTLAGFFKGFSYFLAGRRAELPVYADRLSFMLDLSRNAVIRRESLFRLIRVLALNGFTELQLYTEDTYEIEEEPYFGYLRGRLSREEIAQAAEYAELFGIELVPAIQTLAHLNGLLHWQDYQECFDNGDVLLVDCDRTYTLIENMLKAASRAYKSRRINIGMDEAALLGAGRYQDINGYRPRAEIMKRHLSKVLDLCRKYGFRPMMWSDMFFKTAYNGKYYAADEPITREFLDGFDRPDVQLVYWDYYHDDEEFYGKMIEKHRALTTDFSFAGGAWKWSGFAPLLSLSERNSVAALRACRKYGVRSVMVTAWGDNGAECSPFAVLPLIATYSDSCYGGFDSVQKELFSLYAGDYDAFCKVELANRLSDEPMAKQTNCSCKYFLYNDLLSGVFDSNAACDVSERERRNGREIAQAKKKVGRYGYIFDALAALCDLLTVKADFGVRLKNAYDAKDLAGIKKLAAECDVMLCKTEKFYRLFSIQWNTDNKRNGFEVQTARIGGLMQRIKDVKKILTDYAGGVTDRIPELEAERLDFMGNRSNMSKQTDILYNNYAFTASVNVL